MLIYLRRVPREGGIDGVCPLKSVAAARQLSLESNPCFIGLVGVQFLGSEVIVILTLGPEVKKPFISLAPLQSELHCDIMSTDMMHPKKG